MDPFSNAGEIYDPKHPLLGEKINFTHVLFVFVPIFFFFDKVVKASEKFMCFVGVWQKNHNLEIDEDHKILTKINEKLGFYWNLLPG